MTTIRTMIEVQHLVKDYGGHHAINGLSFSVHPGEVLGFLGPNGAGKTTTMKILTCFIAPTSGEAYVGGHDVLDASLDVRKLVGYLPEDTPLYHDLTPLEFLQFVSALRQVDAQNRAQRIRHVSELCGLMDVLAKPIGALSKGYRQRVGLAQALIHDPQILILDEPTSGLDPNQIVEIRELIKEIGKQKTVILSTHILPEVQATCGRVLIIHEGKIVADGSPHELTHHNAENSYRVLIDSNGASKDTVQHTLRSLSGVAGIQELAQDPGPPNVSTDASTTSLISYMLTSSEKDDLRRGIFLCAKENGWILLEMQRHAVSLEDVFRKLTRDENK